MMTSDYRNLKVWQKAMELTLEIYSLVRHLPKEETYCLSDQMRRAAVSVPSNIAEGHGRASHKDFINFLSISRGSLLELETQLEICNKLDYFDELQLEHARDLLTEISKMLNSLISYRSTLLPQKPAQKKSTQNI